MNPYLIVIPTYNEELNIDEVLEGVLACQLPADVLVVNDGSKDHSGSIVQKRMDQTSDPRLSMITHPFNLGYGAALQTGYKYALKSGYRYVIQFDSDNQHIPDYLGDMIAAAESSGCDVIVGSRFLTKNYKTTLSKRLLIRLMRLLIKLATKNTVTDPTSGMKALSTKAMTMFASYDTFPSDYPDADIIIEIGRRGLTIMEVPISIKERVHGISMHSGLNPVVYVLNMIIGIAVVLIREGLFKERD